MAIPFGFGFKKNILPRLVLSVEWAFRWSLSDRIDGITNEDIKRDYQTAYGTALTEDVNRKQLGFRYTNDWYSVALVGISYTFKIGGLGCPAYYKKHDTRKEHRRGPWTQVCTGILRRFARRSGNPRTPTHVHRSHARTNHRWHAQKRDVQPCFCAR